MHEIEGNISKANSRIFVLIGLGVYLLATIPLIFGLVGSTTMTTYMANGGFQTQVTSFGNAGLFWLAIRMYIVGAITSFIGYIGALIKMARLDQWIWFILLVAFSGVTMLVYIFVGPETHAESRPFVISHTETWQKWTCPLAHLH